MSGVSGTSLVKSPACPAIYRISALLRQVYNCRAIASGLAHGRFESGNGSKILKRLLRIAAMLRVEIDKPSFRSILYHQPALRPALLRVWSLSEDPAQALSI